MEVQTTELATKYIKLDMLAELLGVSYQWLRANMVAGTYPVGRQIGKRWLFNSKELYEGFGMVVTNAMVDEYEKRHKEELAKRRGR